MMKDYLKELNKEQLEAATTVDGYLFILAGAGSGKTKTLIARTSYMIDQGVSPSSILLLTFTNKAATELKNRAVAQIGAKAEGLTACTFHSLCADILRQYGYRLKERKDFTVIDTDDSEATMKEARKTVLDALGDCGESPDGVPTARQLCHLNGRLVNDGVRIDLGTPDISGYFKRDGGCDHRVIIEILRGYDRYKRERKYMDFDDLLSETESLLTTNEDIRAELDARYKYISCDEYQDTNLSQDRILSLLTRDYRNLAVVGDDNQSIYAFRGAKIENILKFRDNHKGCKSVILNQNYRSSQEILDLANAVMEGAKEGIKKYMTATFHSGCKPILVKSDSQYEEAEWIAREVEYRSYNLNDVAVICRSASQSLLLESMLTRRRIPYVKYGGIKFMNKAVVKDILAMMRLTQNPSDELAARRILPLYPRLGKATAEKLIPFLSVMDIAGAVKACPSSARESVKSLFALIDELRGKSPSEVLEKLMGKGGEYRRIREKAISGLKSGAGTKVDARKSLNDGLADAEALVPMAKNYTDVFRFVSDISLEYARNDECDGRLTITTIHSAKGLEWHTVFLMDCVDGITPWTAEGADGDPEELRCFYVALTRAKRELFLMFPGTTTIKGQQCGTHISHFLKEPVVEKCLSVSRC